MSEQVRGKPMKLSIQVERVQCLASWSASLLPCYVNSESLITKSLEVGPILRPKQTCECPHKETSSSLRQTEYEKSVNGVESKPYLIHQRSRDHLCQVCYSLLAQKRHERSLA